MSPELQDMLNEAMAGAVEGKWTVDAFKSSPTGQCAVAQIVKNLGPFDPSQWQDLASPPKPDAERPTSQQARDFALTHQMTRAMLVLPQGQLGKQASLPTRYLALVGREGTFKQIRATLDRSPGKRDCLLLVECPVPVMKAVETLQ